MQSKGTAPLLEPEFVYHPSPGGGGTAGVPTQDYLAPAYAGANVWTAVAYGDEVDGRGGGAVTPSDPTDGSNQDAFAVRGSGYFAVGSGPAVTCGGAPATAGFSAVESFLLS